MPNSHLFQQRAFVVVVDDADDHNDDDDDTKVVFKIVEADESITVLNVFNTI